VRYSMPPTSPFDANITVHIRYKGGDGAETEQTFTSQVAITGSSGNTENNYTFGLPTVVLTQKLPIGMARIWAVTDKNSSGVPLITAGPPAYIAVNDRVSTIYANNLSISVP
jgi:hypothetical protein